MIRDSIFSCDYCRNYVKKVKRAYPVLAKHLQSMGIDIEKPFETMPIDVNEEGSILYAGTQYVVLGNASDFQKTDVSGVHIGIADSHPMTDIKEEHFVVEVSEVNLKWTSPQDDQNGNGS